MLGHVIASLARQFSVDGVSLAWDRWGSDGGDAPFVLCHGFSGSSHDFALTIEDLAVKRQVHHRSSLGHNPQNTVDNHSSLLVTHLLMNFYDRCFCSSTGFASQRVY